MKAGWWAMLLFLNLLNAAMSLAAGTWWWIWWLSSIGAAVCAWTIARIRRDERARQAKSMAPQWASAGYRAGILAEPTKFNGSVDISTFIGPDGLQYISAADTKRLGERARKAMASRRRVKVYQPTRDARAGTNGTVYYGQCFSAAIFDHIEFVDPPRDEHDRQWIREHLMTRIAPAGKVRLSKEMVPHTRTSPSNQWKVGDEIVSVHSEAGTIVMNKAYADRMGIEGKPGKVVEG